MRSNRSVVLTAELGLGVHCLQGDVRSPGCSNILPPSLQRLSSGAVPLTAPESISWHRRRHVKLMGTRFHVRNVTIWGQVTLPLSSKVK